MIITVRLKEWSEEITNIPEGWYIRPALEGPTLHIGVEGRDLAQAVWDLDLFIRANDLNIRKTVIEVEG